MILFLSLFSSFVWVICIICFPLPVMSKKKTLIEKEFDTLHLLGYKAYVPRKKKEQIPDPKFEAIDETAAVSEYDHHFDVVKSERRGYDADDSTLQDFSFDVDQTKFDAMKLLDESSLFATKNTEKMEGDNAFASLFDAECSLFDTVVESSQTFSFDGVSKREKPDRIKTDKSKNIRNDLEDDCTLFMFSQEGDNSKNFVPIHDHTRSRVDEPSILSNLTWEHHGDDDGNHQNINSRKEGLFSDPSLLGNDSTVLECDTQWIDNCSLFSSHSKEGIVVDRLEGGDGSVLTKTKAINKSARPVIHPYESMTLRNNKIRQNVGAALRDDRSLDVEMSEYDKVMDEIDENNVKNRFKPKVTVPKELQLLLEGKCPDEKLRLVLHLADQVVAAPGDSNEGWGSTRNKVLEAVMKKNLKTKANIAVEEDTSMEPLDSNSSRVLYRNVAKPYRSNYASDKVIMDPWMTEKKSSREIEAHPLALTSSVTHHSGSHLEPCHPVAGNRNEQVCELTRENISEREKNGHHSTEPIVTTVMTTISNESDYGLSFLDDLKVDERLNSYTKVIDELEQSQRRRKKKR
jgi:hypothetical protein